MCPKQPHDTDSKFALTELAENVANTIFEGFSRHFRIFNEHTATARELFESADWARLQSVSKARIQGYDLRIAESIEELRQVLGDRESDTTEEPSVDEELWSRVRHIYARKLKEHLQPKLAESYYNSVFCRLHHRRYYHNDNIFVRSAVPFDDIRIETPIACSYECGTDTLLPTLKKILVDFDFRLPFENLDRDLRCVLRRYLDVSRTRVERQTKFRIDVINRPFFRSKAAYLVGRIVTEYGDQPFSIPILNNEKGGLYLDTLILDVDDLNMLFGFARAYFMVETESPAALVSFLQRILLRKSKTELYNHIGFQKHGKTQFYRELLQHLDNNTDNLVQAPGVEGMVMAVFTLASFPYVFKLIKDKFPPEKETTEQQIKEKYMLVKLHDRVGRMADTLEYSHVALPKERFSGDLYEYLCRVAPSKITLDGDKVVIKHLYIERKMTPLNIYLHSATQEQRNRAIRDFGFAIKDMVAANIFPGDMLLKNFGVSRHGRVVFYDYDEIEYMTDMNFRKIPTPRHEEDEFEDRPWYRVGPKDVFPEQFLKFVLIRPEYREPFLTDHSDLLDAGFWNRQKHLILKGVYQNIFPYPESSRFCHVYNSKAH